MGRPGVKAHRLAIDIFADKISVEVSSKIDPGVQYSQMAPIARRRQLGQFFTPAPIAAVMADWIMTRKPTAVLDPAVGTGAFLQAIAEKRGNECVIDAFDIDPVITSFIPPHLVDSKKTSIQHSDFLITDLAQKYDAVIMNPPYLRHHDINYDIDIFKRISSLTGVNISRLANSYVLFALKACEALKPGGRGAFIIPTEWANANFGGALKSYLLKKNILRRVIYFSNCSEVFSDALTTACILLVENSPMPSSTIALTYIEGATAPFPHTTLSSLDANYVPRQISGADLLTSPKWDQLVRRGKTDNRPGFVPLRALASTKRGIATGANDYFHITANDVERIGIQLVHQRQCVGRAIDVRGYVFRQSDFDSMVAANKRTHLIDINHSPDSAERKYLKLGEEAELPKRYLLSKRKPWYSMEARKPAPIWAAVFGRDELRFIYNEAQVHNLTTFHGVYPNNRSPAYVRALVAVLNSQIVQENARANIRVYGGGLLKFEPRDILDVPVPNIDLAKPDLIAALSENLDKLHTGAIAAKDLNDLTFAAANQASKCSTQLF